MSCFKPLKLYRVIDPASGMLGQIRSYGGYINDFDEFEKDNPLVQKWLVPCGQCDDCRRDQAHEWSNRLVLESLAQGEDRSWFVTLTYDDDHMPTDFICDRQNGSVGLKGVLRMSDVSAWLKRLRNKLNEPGIRFYAAGEYGDSTRRPHYHVILFASLPDARPVRPVDGDRFVALPPGTMFSQIIEDTWKLGGTSVSPANLYTMSYVAGYVTKKLSGKFEQDYQQLVKLLQLEHPELHEQPRERALMSRRPGIGVPYLEQHMTECETGRVAVPVPHGAMQMKVPRLFESRMTDRSVNAFKLRRARLSQAKRDCRKVYTSRALDYDLILKKRARDNDPLKKARARDVLS